MSVERLGVAEHQQYYILAPRVAVPERVMVLKHDDCFGLFNEFGDIDIDARHEEGLYYEGTRFLSRLLLRLVGGRPLLLSSAVRRDNLLVSSDLTNPDVYRDGHVVLPHGSLHIFRSKLIFEGACHERIHVRNFTRDTLALSLAIDYAADYADIFEVRGQERPRRGSFLEPRVAAGQVQLGYEGLDGIARRTLIDCQPAPAHSSASQMQLEVRLGGRSEQVFELTIACECGTTRRVRRHSKEAAQERATREREDAARFRCSIETSNDLFNAWLERSAADLNMLLTATPHGLYPSAGVPWFDTTFGRDGIITALECLWLSPAIARGVLAFLAATQADSTENERDAEPGKILHEARRGEMANLGEIPFGRYYGSVDATPLFVMLAGAYWRRTGDLAFIESIWPNVCAALRWMESYGDPDGDGFIEYHRRSHNGLVQQGWKDSHDSVFHADGRFAEGPIALCEVQGYTYCAWLVAAELAAALGQLDMARTLRDAARGLRERFQKRFWCEEIGVYALALDGDKRPCRIRSSNAGHCLMTGIAAEEHTLALLQSFSEDAFFSGWGVRTVADTESRYNPMAYHNGSIWPHDNAMIAAGMQSLTDKTLAARILHAQFEASTYFTSSRLPELFCGFRRREGKPPTSYPVACSPQAWSAGAVFMQLEACLGLSIDAARGQIVFRYPCLPACLERVVIRGLSAGSGTADLVLTRYAGRGISVHVERRRGKIEVLLIH